MRIEGGTALRFHSVPQSVYSEQGRDFCPASIMSKAEAPVAQNGAPTGAGDLMEEPGYGVLSSDLVVRVFGCVQHLSTFVAD